MTITTKQVKLLMKNLKKYNKETAAAKAGMDRKTARKYINNKKLPGETKANYTRTVPTIFAEHSDELAKMLEASPGLQAKTLITYLSRKYPDKYKLSQLRSLQRYIHDWKALYGSSQPIIFSQDIQPGKQSQSDYTCMNDLNVTINGALLKHLLFHFMLPYSRWESINLCYSESFDTLVCGYEKAVWELGCTASEHRTDNLTAATHAMGSRREFNDCWRQFMAYYKITPTTNNVGVSNENGSVEKSHDTLKNAIAQELMLRGSANFTTIEDYVVFIENIVTGRNATRQDQLLVEMEHFVELPDKKWHAPTVIRVRVSSGSIVQILGVPYSVPSRLIHYMLKAYIYPDKIVLFYGNKNLQTMPRSATNSLTGINYRHLIDGLVRKPAAFANYKYHEAMFPRLCFRKAYDALRVNIPANADKQYLKLLQLAKLNSEQEVAAALELLLEKNHLPLVNSVKSLIDTKNQEHLGIKVYQPNVADYDYLLSSITFTVGH